jgi:ATP synthase F1 delta subunit
MGLDDWNLSIKYAKAFFNIHGAQLQEADFWKIRQAAAALVKNKSALNVFSLYNQFEQQKVIAIILNHFKLSLHFGKLLLLLQNHKRILLLPDVLNEVSELFLHQNKQLFFQISSYPLLSGAQQEHIVVYLQRTTGMKILYNVRQDQALISGVKMQSKYLLYEDTISNRLQKIHRKLVRQN